MKTRNLNKASGQILILLAVGLVALLGFVALALDGGSIYLDRRSAQNAADAAALAGAYQLAWNPWDAGTLSSRISAAASSRAHDNGYASADGKVFNVYYPPDISTIKPVNGDTTTSNYVRVTITSPVKTSFLQLVFSGGINNTVESVAHVSPPSHGNPWAGSGIVALDPSGTGYQQSGNFYANLINGGITVNSSSSSATGGPSNSSTVVTAKLNMYKNGNNTISPTNLIFPGAPNATSTFSNQYAVPPSIIPPAPDCAGYIKNNLYTAINKGPTTVNGTLFDAWLSPDPASPGGIYGRVPDGLLSKNSVYFDHGIYCVNVGSGGNGVIMNSKYNYYNDPSAGGILLVLAEPTGTTLSKNTNACNFSINGGSSTKMTGWNTDPYAGVVIYVDPIVYSNPPGPGSLLAMPWALFTINGNGSTIYSGTIYAPTCNVNLSGNNNTVFDGQVIGYDVTVSGSGTFNLVYNDKYNLQAQIPAKVDLNQ